MSRQKPIGVCQTALLISTHLQYEAVIHLQARARIPVIKSVSDLHTEFLVPKIGNYGHVFDTTTQQFTFTHLPFTPIELNLHFTVIHSPQNSKNPNPVKNLALQKFVGSNRIVWLGNLIVIAHVPDGAPVPFTHDHVEAAKILFSNLLRLRTVKDVLKYAQWRVYRPLSEVPVTAERNSYARTVFPNEMLLAIFERCDARSLAALSATSSGMRTMVRASLSTVVRGAISQFMPEDKIAEFFDCLADVKGVVFSDVALRVQLREDWALSMMYIATPRGQSFGFVGWFTACGYSRRPIARARAWGSLHVYGLQNERVPSRWVYIYESENEFAVTPVLAAKSTGRMTMLTGHALISPYTKLTEERVCITSTPLDILHFQTLGFKVALDAKDLGLPCETYCPRNKRTLESRHGIDVVPWGGLRGDEAIPDIELDVLKSNLSWTLGNTCHNVLCGKCGVDRDILLF
ncbi:hypothetical protein CCMSSC00406_0007095 [Pleurotus cornucopiae]|uniref:Uncharacterized protein n=1 Tax=Pleurotus cornucopiae TaxID=5321 RepID=A0ACB7J632_PLECO|nr:hypothetical protein CCMSSC00406_0007095 [Pleurotus cornucopiae]